jgi:hypothetical protein
LIYWNGATNYLKEGMNTSEHFGTNTPGILIPETRVITVHWGNRAFTFLQDLKRSMQKLRLNSNTFFRCTYSSAFFLLHFETSTVLVWACIENIRPVINSFVTKTVQHQNAVFKSNYWKCLEQQLKFSNALSQRYGSPH